MRSKTIYFNMIGNEYRWPPVEWEDLKDCVIDEADEVTQADAIDEEDEEDENEDIEQSRNEDIGKP